MSTRKLTFPSLFEASVRSNADNIALSFVDGKPLTYKEMDLKIKMVMQQLTGLGIKPGDKVALLSLNSPEWGLTYFAITFLGAVVVPMLPDFTASELQNILVHSEAKALFVSERMNSKIKKVKSEFLKHKIKIDDFSVIESTAKDTTVESTSTPYEVQEDDLAAIIYTSGTTGNSKGVMLTHKNISFTALQSDTIQVMGPTDRFLSVLPLSHTYENTLGFVAPMFYGSSIYYLKGLPTPSVLLPALKKVKPTFMFTVPLIIEKIYRNKVLATFNKNAITRTLYKFGPTRKILNKAAGKKLLETFGGHLIFFGIGGAKLNKAVERFLMEAKFPYAIGYGLTETAPLLAGSGPFKTKMQSTGPLLKGVELKIHEPDQKTGQGEIWAKGPNVMQGYYKDPENTKAVLTADGWFKTGDLGSFDKAGNLSINGRLKNMIVGASGENIYPEEIESVINNFKHVVESLVVQKKGKLVALVHFNKEELEERYNHLKDDMTNYMETKMEELKQELQAYVNERVNKFSQVQIVLDQVDPFKKTATKKIKRFLYA